MVGCSDKYETWCIIIRGIGYGTVRAYTQKIAVGTILIRWLDISKAGVSFDVKRLLGKLTCIS